MFKKGRSLFQSSLCSAIGRWVLRILAPQWYTANARLSFGRTLPQDSSTSERKGPHFVSNKVRRVAPVLADNHDRGVEVALPQRPHTNVFRVESPTIHILGVRQSGTEMARLSSGDQLSIVSNLRHGMCPANS